MCVTPDPRQGSASAAMVSRRSSASASTGVTSWNMIPGLGKSGTTRIVAANRSVSRERSLVAID
jgi:hypothetical protein